jgi:hypothetical protein
MKVVTILFIGLVLCVVIMALVAYSTMILWNILLPELFQFPVIDFWQALGLIILSRLLFGSVSYKSKYSKY